MSETTPSTCQLCGGETKLYQTGDYWLCEDCTEKVQTYSDRMDSRLARLKAREQKAMQEYETLHERAHKMASGIPFGQPILVGHHSEGRDRRYRNRIHTTFGKAFEHYKKSEHYAGRVHAAENNRAISSDDPLAILKLREQIQKAEEVQELMKKVNATIRKNAKKSHAEQIAALVTLNISEARAEEFLKGDFLQRRGYPHYRLTNNNANIRRMKERLADLEKKAETAKKIEASPDLREETHGDVRLVRDTADNRLRLIFPGKPEPSTITLLKQSGFRWSPYNKAWQRQLNNGAEYAAKTVLESLGVLVETPAQPEPSPSSELTADTGESTEPRPLEWSFRCDETLENFRRDVPDGRYCTPPEPLPEEQEAILWKLRDELAAMPSMAVIGWRRLYWIARILANQFCQNSERVKRVRQNATIVHHILVETQVVDPAAYNRSFHIQRTLLSYGLESRTTFAGLVDGPLLLDEDAINALLLKVAGKLPSNPLEDAKPPKQLPLL